MAKGKCTYLREVEIRYNRKRADGDLAGANAADPQKIVSLFSDLEDETKEKFITVSIDSRFKILCFEVVAVGAVNRVSIRPLEVFRTSFVFNAYGAIILHNHPTGDPTPSPADKSFTRKLKRFADAAELRLHDHIIIGKDDHYSFAMNNLL